MQLGNLLLERLDLVPCSTANGRDLRALILGEIQRGQPAVGRRPAASGPRSELIRLPARTLCHGERRGQNHGRNRRSYPEKSVCHVNTL
jgi:hypothetical protein